MCRVCVCVCVDVRSPRLAPVDRDRRRRAVRGFAAAVSGAVLLVIVGRRIHVEGIFPGQRSA